MEFCCVISFLLENYDYLWRMENWMETTTFFYLALMQFCLHDLIDKKTQFFPIILLLLGRMLSPLFFFNEK